MSGFMKIQNDNPNLSKIKKLSGFIKIAKITLNCIKYKKRVQICEHLQKLEFPQYVWTMFL